MPITGEKIPLFLAVQIVVDGALGLGRADDILQARAKQHRALHQSGKVFAVDIAQLAEPAVLLVLVGVYGFMNKPVEAEPSYAEVRELFESEQVSAFTVTDTTLRMKLREVRIIGSYPRAV